MNRFAIALGAAIAASAVLAADPAPAAKPRSTADILAASTAADWRRLDPANTLYLDLDAGRVVIELSRYYTPEHVAAIKLMAESHYWDGLAINRVQDNFVVQWGDPDSVRPLKTAMPNLKLPLAPEFTRKIAKDLPFTALPDADGWAKKAGFTDGMAAAQTGADQWLVHCYGAIGVGRDNAANSGDGNELYVVIGQSPRQLDGNVAVVGKVWRGMELLASLPRGTEGGLGLYATPAQRVPIKSLRLASAVPENERTNLEVMRDDRPVFAQFVEARRNRTDDWYLHKAGHIDVCNINVPVRDVK
jgi:cyclophilin family peptidyl-prolyl cis-trans isomerase